MQLGNRKETVVVKMKKRCLIMMTSYNGEKYISEQINTIINQTYKNWQLIIQDDGSTDKTLDIINKYVKTDSRISLYKNNDNHGAYCNFHSLIKKCKKLEPYDYYMFADHDDAWMTNKMQKMIAFCEKKSNKNIPTLVYADMKMTDENGVITDESFNKALGITYKNSVSTFFSQDVYGCNTFLNYKLFEMVPSIDTNDKMCKRIPHDAYFMKFAALKGKLLYLDEPLMLYRRHGNNVTSKQTYSFGIKKLFKRLLSIDNLAKSHESTYSHSLFTIKKMRTISLEPNERQLIDEVERCIKKGGFSSLKFFIQNKVYCGKRIKTISRGFILFTGLYKKYLVE